MSTTKRRKLPLIPRLIIGGLVVVLVGVLTAVFILNNRSETVQSDLHRSVFYVNGEAGSVGGFCQLTSIDNTDYCVKPGSLNGTVSGKYKVDASYRLGKKTFQNSANPPREESLPTIFIETVYSITKVE